MPTTVSVPGRIEVLGNHTDYNGGRVLVAPTRRVVTVRVERTADRRVTVSSDDFPGRVLRAVHAIQLAVGRSAWANYVLGAVAILRREGMSLGGMRIHVSGDLPIGAGLASSAALSVATLRAILRASRRRMVPLQLAACARQVETVFVGVPVGPLDPLSCVLGRRGQLLRLDFAAEPPRADWVAMPPGWRLLVFDSGQRRALVAGRYALRGRECAAAARSLGVTSLGFLAPAQFERRAPALSARLRRRARHIVMESARVDAAWRILGRPSGGAVGIGALLKASQLSSVADFENSHATIDRLVARLRAIPEVAGARLTGGGFGGAVIGWVRRENVPCVLAQLAADRRGAPRLLDLA
jgi:galactokinase